MKPAHILMAISVLMAAAHPVPAQKSVYQLPIENSWRLPSMDTKINTEELSATYQTLGNIYTTEITGLGDHRMQQTSMRFSSDAKVVDAWRFLEIYMADYLVTPGRSTHGTVEMSIIYFHERKRINAGTVLGVLTFGLGTLFGIPYATAVTDVEIEASVFDPDMVQVTSNRGVGRGRNLLHMYNNSTRKAHQRALRHALEDLNRKVAADQLLQKVGTD